MKKIILYTFLGFYFWSYSQVGVNTTEPHAQLDIRSSSQANPTNIDGLLIPKIDNFPVNNPGTEQNGMMVFLTTTVGSNTPGFYYWEAVSSAWIPIKGPDGGTLNQAYNFGGAGAGNTIIADAGAVTIAGTDGLVSTGTSGLGALAPDGAGVRMVWNPRKSAFRVGSVGGTQWDDVNIGNSSFAFGTNTTASAGGTVAFGTSTVASAVNSTAFGVFATASGPRSTAFGASNTASGSDSTVFGTGSTATGTVSTAFGIGTSASGDFSTTFGRNTLASNFNSTAFGSLTTASGTGSTAFGSNTISSGDVSTAFGSLTTASAFGSTTFGSTTTAAGNFSTAFGIQNTAISYGETVIGIGSTFYTPSENGANQFRAANATDRLFVVGNAIDLNNNGSVDDAERSDAMIVLKSGLTRLPSMDNAMIDAGDGKTVVIKEYLEERSSGTLDQAYDFGGAGVGNTIIADAGAVAIAGTDGFVSTGTLNSGAIAPSGIGVRMVWNPRKAAFRVGAVNTTQWDDDNVGLYSTAFGENSTASGEHSISFGLGNIASGSRSTSFGSITTASGPRSTAFGLRSIASGVSSTAFGSVTTASNFFSTAFGDQTTASGLGSTAFGSSTISSSEYSTAFGRGTAALGSVSTTFGRSNTATSYGETVIGIGATTYTPSTNGATQFRTANATDRLFVIGNAIDANNNNTVDDAERSDAMVVLKNGNTGIGSSTPQDRLHVVGNIRMVDGNQAAGRIMVSNANGTASWQTLDVPALNGWSTLGNTGLNATTNFIGTTNAVDVIFRRNNLRAGRLGASNTSFGVNALSPAGTGIFNTAVGSASLESITNGSRNAAVGSVSLNANTTGDNNTALGVDALSFNETGNSNTAVGRRAMGSVGAVSSGSNNTALGYFAYSTGNFSNSTALGANTAITANNQIRLGNNAVTSIGGAVGFTNLSDRRFKKNIQYNAPGLAFIKKLKPATYQLDMESMARFLGTPEESRDRNAERIRENMPETGFIAQEVEQAAREVGFVFSGVDVPHGNNDYYGLRYSSFVVPLVKAIQEQQQIIESQKEKITQLQEQYRLLLQRVERLEQH